MNSYSSHLQLEPLRSPGPPERGLCCVSSNPWNKNRPYITCINANRNCGFLQKLQGERWIQIILCSSTGVPGISETRSGGGVVMFDPAVLSPAFGCLAELLLLLLLTLDVLCICLDPVALCIAAGVHSCVREWKMLTDWANICAGEQIQLDACSQPAHLSVLDLFD